jgi:hypothetical protein
VWPQRAAQIFEYKIYRSCLGAIPSDLSEREVLQLSLSDKLDFKVLISLGDDAAKARKSIRRNAELERVWNASRSYDLQTGVLIRQTSHGAINHGTPAVECDLPSLEHAAANIESCGLSRYPCRAPVPPSIFCRVEGRICTLQQSVSISNRRIERRYAEAGGGLKRA